MTPAVTPPSSLTAPLDRELQRSVGVGRIVFGASRGRSRLVDLYQASPVRILFPRFQPEEINEAVIVNTAGGIAGGDDLTIDVSVLPGASLCVTSQAAEKVYRALSDPATVSTKLRVHETATLAWLPQDTILFDGARIRRTTEIDLAPEAKVLALEWFVFGREAYGENLRRGFLSDSWRVRRDGRLLWADTFRIDDHAMHQLSRQALLGSFRAVATLLYSGPECHKQLELFQELTTNLPCKSAVTLVEGVMIFRFAAERFAGMSKALTCFLERCGRRFEVSPFRTPKMWSC